MKLAKLRGLLAPAAVCLLGLWMAFHPMLDSGLRRMQTDPGDPRLVNYHQEYVYRWLTGAPAYGKLWSPPFYYPAPNTAAYGDVHFANAPIYVPWRLLGIPADTAFQFWLFTALTLNFAVAYLLLRRGLSLGTFPALMGAYLYGFGLARVNAINHPQLLPGFYLMGALYALLKLFDEDAGRRRMWIAVFTACFVAQMYSGLYIAWFFGLALGFAFAWAAVWPDTRERLLRQGRAHWRELAVAAVLAAALAAPLAWHYGTAAREVGLSTEVVVTDFQPRLLSWLHAGPESWTYGRLAKMPAFATLPAEGEHRVGIGIVALVLAMLGLWRERRRPLARLLLLTTMTVVVFTTRWPGNISLWEIVILRFVPAARAVRAPVRIGILMLVPGMFGLAWLLRAWPAGWRGRLAGAALLGLFALEQAATTRSYDKLQVRGDVNAVVHALSPRCRAFIFTPDAGNNPEVSYKYHVDAMFASAETGIPTLNGNGGRIPPGWFGFNSVMIRDADNERAVHQLILSWAADHQLEPTGVCWVRGTIPFEDWEY